ncbi:MAG TPA: hypothetical protein PL101_02605 [Bacteroidales bacterium]|mgnify:FL=1|jgi:hypothetical protein|nr:hypothetical protein [Bacteroidales bacterium]
MRFKDTLRKNLINIPGWRTKRKIIVIESDDWGSVRMPSREVYELLLLNGIPVDKLYFLQYDSLESEQDLTMLFEVLYSFKDKFGNHPVITANTIVANPNFEKIKASGKIKYYYEPFTETYKKYPNHSRSFDLWRTEGIANNLLWPQFHGREHLNVKKWMNAINSSDQWELEAFNHDVLLGYHSEKTINYMPAFDYSNPEECEYLNTIVAEGLDLFKRIFGFSSKSFVAPCSVKGDNLDNALKNKGVLFQQFGKHYIPNKSDAFKIKNRFWGQQNNVGQIYWRRNVTFEPSRDPKHDWVDNCLSMIDIAFRWGKPAVIGSHRVNYIGSIFPENRSFSLLLLKKILKQALKHWPEIEFMSSDQLGEVILQSKKDKNLA